MHSCILPLSHQASDRLNGSVMASIERQLAQKLEFKDIINYFTTP